MNFQKWFIIAMGVFSIAAAILDWDWFFNNPRAQFFVRLFGNNRRNARIFYIVLGGLLCWLGFTL